MFALIDFIVTMPLKELKRLWRTRSSDAHINYLRSRGIKIGEGCKLRDPRTTAIDKTRPSLVEIGDNVDMNANFTILTHDYVTAVFLAKYNDYINSSGKVKIGSNIYFGKNCTILKGVTIGDNVVVAANSLVTRDIPSDCVAAGSPAKVVCTIDEYYNKRRTKSLEEAFEYARSIVDRYGRRPIAEDFTEEFPLFVSGNEVDKYPNINIKGQLCGAYDHWVATHKAPFNNLDDFLHAAGIEK